MLILISPAKKLSTQEFSFTDSTIPFFQAEACTLIQELRSYSPEKLQTLMGISSNLALLNYARYRSFQKKIDANLGSPALYLFAGDVYQNIDKESFVKKNRAYAQKHLGILSGLYGYLRPMDLIQPYRLEMGTKLKIKKCQSLIDYWHLKILKHITKELELHENRFILNLASQEYFKAIGTNHDIPIVNVEFKEEFEGTYKSFGLLSKRARGMMVSYIIKNEINDIERVKKFKTAGYRYQQSLSHSHNLVFTRKKK